MSSRLKNFNFAKLIDRVTLDYPDLNRYTIPNLLPVPDNILIEEGYKRIVHVPCPSEPTNVNWSSYFTEETDTIVEHWEYTPWPEPEPVDDPVLDMEEQIVDHEYRLLLLELGLNDTL